MYFIHNYSVGVISSFISVQYKKATWKNVSPSSTDAPRLTARKNINYKMYMNMKIPISRTSASANGLVRTIVNVRRSRHCVHHSISLLQFSQHVIQVNLTNFCAG